MSGWTIEELATRNEQWKQYVASRNTQGEACSPTCVGNCKGEQEGEREAVVIRDELIHKTGLNWVIEPQNIDVWTVKSTVKVHGFTGDPAYIEVCRVRYATNFKYCATLYTQIDGWGELEATGDTAYDAYKALCKELRRRRLLLGVLNIGQHYE